MIWFSSHETALKRRRLEIQAMISTTAMPLNREFERVWMTSLMTLYIKMASMATSTILCQSGCSKRLVNSAPMEVNISRICTMFATPVIIFLSTYIIIQNRSKSNVFSKTEFKNNMVTAQRP